jgi:hypothetical protein
VEERFKIREKEHWKLSEGAELHQDVPTFSLYNNATVHEEIHSRFERACSSSINHQFREREAVQRSRVPICSST